MSIPDSDRLAAEVHEDLNRAFADALDAQSARFEVPDEFAAEAEPMANDRFAALPWRYSAEHTGVLGGLQPTGKTLHIEGVTIVEDLDGSEPSFRRIIDWVAVMAQLGLSTSGRPVVDDPTTAS